MVTKKLNNWINQDEILIVRPALPNKGTQLPQKVLDSAIGIALKQHAVLQNITIQQTHSLILEYATVMSMIVKRMENLELGNYIISVHFGTEYIFRCQHRD